MRQARREDFPNVVHEAPRENLPDAACRARRDHLPDTTHEAPGKNIPDATHETLRENLSDVAHETPREDLSDAARRARRENFPVASRLLPRSHRHHLLAVYGFARFVDDIGDEPQAEDPLRLLDDVDADLDRLYAGQAPRLPAVSALERAVGTCSIPARPFRRLVEANRVDQSVSRYDTFDDLLAYCELSANPVGHIVLHVFGMATPARLALSDRVCSALQVIEHCQDVGEDYTRGRVYLPGEDLRRFGCVESDLAKVVTPTRLRGVVALQTERARRLLHEGDPLVSSVTGFTRFAVAGYMAGGLATVAALTRARYDVLGHAVRPRRTRLLTEWLRILSRRRPGRGDL
ncbi:squalene synthase HpnC [Streptosporangium subroseum]|uniref:Squalene synthase HpnC n=1 Tax=Streptosporangium subroseum TaxID=106412 RepID=A0A239BJ55_9ACTN|nr:squalene synthase HpnC [Streptosporangium subroseum]SNS08217.1 squalene synthase HpnC [Streptosporangium subroseum]